MKNIKKVVLSTIASGFLVSALASNYLGEITNPDTTGSCPIEFNHVDLNNDGVIDNGECWSGIHLKNGKVGIGTNNPSAKLEINGDVKITDGIVQEDWTKATLLNGWQPYQNDSTYTPASFKDSQGMIHVKGFLRATGMTDKIIFTLPQEHWPEHFMYYTLTIMGSENINLYVNTNGDVSVSSYPGNEVPLNGISFRAAN